MRLVNIDDFPEVGGGYRGTGPRITVGDVIVTAVLIARLHALVDGATWWDRWRARRNADHWLNQALRELGEVPLCEAKRKAI